MLCKLSTLNVYSRMILPVFCHRRKELKKENFVGCSDAIAKKKREREKGKKALKMKVL